MVIQPARLERVSSVNEPMDGGPLNQLAGLNTVTTWLLKSRVMQISRKGGGDSLTRHILLG